MMEVNKLSPLDFVNGCSPSLFNGLGLNIERISGCSYGASGAMASLLNGVLSCSINNSEVEPIVDAVFNYFSDKGLPHSWWVEAAGEPSLLKSALENRGLNLLGVFPGLILNTDEAIAPKASEELQIESVAGKSRLDLWSGVIGEAFGFSEDVSIQYAALYEKLGMKGPFQHLTGIKNGKVVCTGSLLTTEHGAYIYNIATTENERQRGYASNITYSLIQLAKSQNVKRVALVSSPPALSLYFKLGFKEVAHYHIYA